MDAQCRLLGAVNIKMKETQKENERIRISLRMGMAVTLGRGVEVLYLR